ncbi:MAG: hypothetical protein QOF16_1787, partial [Actinomycetota bacterium]|nr:hypothetical protein [Actinomycetota bacterium]
EDPAAPLVVGRSLAGKITLIDSDPQVGDLDRADRWIHHDRDLIDIVGSGSVADHVCARFGHCQFDVGDAVIPDSKLDKGVATEVADDRDA